MQIISARIGKPRIERTPFARPPVLRPFDLSNAPMWLEFMEPVIEAVHSWIGLQPFGKRRLS
jgi:hypothetical protein